ncbi:MAG: adenylosuccinate synthetase, partial [Oscillospiraceae bacterium]
TKSGIAPFYSDKYLKIGIQVGEIFDDKMLKERLESICEKKNTMIKAMYPTAKIINVDDMFNYVIKYRERLKPLVKNVTVFLNNAIKENKCILLEGQLGALKDTDNGIYPMVTSSSPLAGFATVGAGIPPHAITKIVTVVKAYSSAVGAGAFVSEIFGEQADELRKRGGDGGEFGATTGRPRRMGWLDTVATKYGCMLQGTTDVAFSVIDVLGYLDTIPVCTGYEIDGVVTTDFPVTSVLEKAKPIIEYLDGWKCDISGIKEYDKLPENCKKYIEFVEEKIGYPITLISNGPKREDIIYRNI